MFKKILIFLLAGHACALERGDLDKYGLFRSILNSRFIRCAQDRSLNLNVSDIHIYIFDYAKNSNKTFKIHDASQGILNIDNLDKNRQFILFVGGFTSNIDHEIEIQIREAYKTYPNSYLIIPDHSAYTNNKIGNLRGYERAVTYIRSIGNAIGQFLARLHLGGIGAKNIHCIGHSLGGHILGHAGTAFFEETGERISRISALDPAGPCFTNNAVEDQIRSGVAEYVEVYHCNAGTLGSSSILGDVDFIVNKRGEMQPNCGTTFLPVIYGSTKAAACNHRMCVDVWTASVKNPEIFSAYNCESYEKFRNGECESNDMTIPGAANPRTAKGVYYFSTAMFNIRSLK